MRRTTIIPALSLLLFLPLSALAWTGQWNNMYPFSGRYPPYTIPPGSLVQLIHAGNNGVVDDPFQWFLSHPNPAQICREWRLSGYPPVGDDTLRDQTVFLDYGPGYEGYFGKSISGTDGEKGDPWYTRFFTNAEDEKVYIVYYGEVGDPEDPNDPIYELVLYGWNGSSYDFGDYKITLEGVCADMHGWCCPEPTTLALAAAAAILALFKARKLL